MSIGELLAGTSFRGVSGVTENTGPVVLGSELEGSSRNIMMRPHLQRAFQVGDFEL